MQLIASSSATAAASLDLFGDAGANDVFGQPSGMTLSSAELRTLAAQWRADCVGEDFERAERVARTLEWVAEQREQRASGTWMGLVSRLVAWVRVSRL